MISINELLQMDEYDRAAYLCEKARNIGKRLNPEYEEMIKINSKWAYFYARYVIEDRWKEAEEYIKKDPYYAYEYARYIIKGRWKEAEEYIMEDSVIAYLYRKFILKKPKAFDSEKNYLEYIFKIQSRFIDNGRKL